MFIMTKHSANPFQFIIIDNRWSKHISSQIIAVKLPFAKISLVVKIYYKQEFLVTNYSVTFL